MSPKEKNARTLVGVLAEHFPAGSSCGDLRLKFQQIANLKHASFYACLAFAKKRGWIVTDGPPITGSCATIYSLNPDGCWRPPPIGEGIERHQFEHVLTMRAERIEKLETRNRQLHAARKAIAAGEAAGPAISTLLDIMLDPKVSIRGRLQAAENLLAYKSPPDIATAARVFLAQIFTDCEQNIDHRLAATTALRRSEDVRIMPPIERPVRTDAVESAEPIEDLKTLAARQKARMERLLAMSLEERAALIPGSERRDDST
jgi:hypothetical protein